MNRKNKWMVLIGLTVIIIFIKLFSAQPSLVESYYSTGIYPYISFVLKFLLGWMPFSMGDIVYGILIIWLLVKIFRILQNLVRKKLNKSVIKARAYKVLTGAMLIYIIFNLLWGINYNRKGITSQLDIKLEKYTTQELVTIDSVLLGKVNESKTFLLKRDKRNTTSGETFEAAKKAYSAVADKYPFLQYKSQSIKVSLWGWAGNYIGFTGYYNPFTGEAQVNTTVPTFLQPFTSCHEIAHQLGYAKENEANFVGYLAASGSSDTLLHYSVYLDLFLYAQRNLFEADSAKAKYFSKQLIPGVKADLMEWKKFNEAHKSPLEVVFRWLYGKYLENNQQPSGLLTYDEVTGFLVAYYKKFGAL